MPQVDGYVLFVVIRKGNPSNFHALHEFKILYVDVLGKINRKQPELRLPHWSTYLLLWRLRSVGQITFANDHLMRRLIKRRPESRSLTPHLN